MKTATVEQLHDQQTDVLGWIEAGEEVTISHKGVVIARLVPEKNGAAPAYLRDRSAEPVLSTEEVSAVLNENKGSW